MNASVSAHRWLFAQLADLTAAAYEQTRDHGQEYLPVFHLATDFLNEVAESMVTAINASTPELVDDES